MAKVLGRSTWLTADALSSHTSHLEEFLNAFNPICVVAMTIVDKLSVST